MTKKEKQAKVALVLREFKSGKLKSASVVVSAARKTRLKMVESRKKDQ